MGACAASPCPRCWGTLCAPLLPSREPKFPGGGGEQREQQDLQLQPCFWVSLQVRTGRRWTCHPSRPALDPKTSPEGSPLKVQTYGGAGSMATPGITPWPYPALHYPRIIRCEPPALPVCISGDNMDGPAPRGTGAQVLHPEGHLLKSVAACWVAPAPLELVQAVAFKPRGLFPGFTVKRCAIRTRARCDRRSAGAAWQSRRAAPSKTPLLPKPCPAVEAAASEVG